MGNLSEEQQARGGSKGEKLIPSVVHQNFYLRLHKINTDFVIHLKLIMSHKIKLKCLSTFV